MASSFVDNGFLAAANAVQAPDYWKDFSRMYSLFEDSPWSYRNKRKAQQEDFAQQMQLARFQAEMAEKAQNQQIKQQLLPYQIAKLQGGGGVYGSPAPQGNIAGQLQNWFGTPPEVVEQPVTVEDNQIPDVVDTGAVNMGFIPDAP